MDAMFALQYSVHMYYNRKRRVNYAFDSIRHKDILANTSKQVFILFSIQSIRDTTVVYSIPCKCKRYLPLRNVLVLALVLNSY